MFTKFLTARCSRSRARLDAPNGARAAAAITALVFAFFAAGAASADPLDANWSSDFSAPGLNGTIEAMVNWNNTLVAAGTITHAGGNRADNIVSWNGAEFAQMGQGLNGTVTSLAVVGTTLYAAGDFTASGATPLPNIARWTGSAWVAVGAGAPDNAYDLQIVADGSSLLVLGDFSSIGSPPVAAQCIARWNGSAWSDVGGFDNAGEATLQTAARIGSTLYVGGSYRAGSTLHSWDGVNWTYDIGGIDGDVTSLAVLGSDLYLAGDFYSVEYGAIPAERIARWDGSTFTSLAGISPDGDIAQIGVDNGMIFAVGSFLNSPGPYCAYWDGSNWINGPSRLWGISGANVEAFARVGGDLFFGGRMNGFYDFTMGGVIRGAWGIAAWNGSQFRALGPGFGVADGQYINGLSTYGGDLVAAGSFRMIGRLGGAFGLARWDGTQWSAFGGGLDEAFGNPSGDELATWNGRLVVSGYFTGADGTNSENIIAWNGSSWEGFNGGFTGQGVEVMNFGTDLVVAGFLGTEIGSGTPLGHVARWSGTQWQTVGTMSPSTGASATRAIVWNGKVICAGIFSSMNGVAATNIAQWNGTAWSALGAGLNARVSSLVVHNGDLYASGDFTASGAAPLPGRLARWTGSAWVAVTPNLELAAEKMLSADGKIFVIGYYNTAGGVPAKLIAAWDGTAWSALGSGLAQGVDGNNLTALTLAHHDDALFVGGFFSTAGDKSSQRLARWDLGSATPVEHGDVAGDGAFGDGDASRDGMRLTFLSANPATDRVRLLLHLPTEASVEASVFDISGRRVKLLTTGRMAANAHPIEWDGSDEAGRRAGAGIYWVRVHTDDAAATRKVVWIR
ncbi:MAG: FlgD immunoglobulin-like domain containing protein [bacterium]